MHKVKRTTVTVFLFIFAVTLFAAFALLPRRLAFGKGESYRFFVGDTSLNCREVAVSYAAAPIVRLTLKEVCGESATYKSLDLPTFLGEVHAEIVFCEELSDSVNYYCRASLPYAVTIRGEEINLHVCVKESATVVASPIIFGGY